MKSDERYLSPELLREALAKLRKESGTDKGGLVVIGHSKDTVWVSLQDEEDEEEDDE